MKNKLQLLFPMIRTREEVLKEIQGNDSMSRIFRKWTHEQQEEFLDFTTGAKGVKILYDSFFKEILNPEIVPERLNDLLSQLLKKKVRILHVLPVDSTRLGDETSLVIMDIVVELSDKSVVNIEIQKIGYRFPGERSACYSADLLLRQYKAAREKSDKKRFSYKSIYPVYTIVFFETSPIEFHEFPDDYLHNFGQASDTGLKLELLQKYLFIPLDIFYKNLQNRGIRSRRDAWLAFLCCDDPEVIACIIDKYPEFKAMYQHIYDICENTEKVMEMFSKELQELDRNTVQLMIDEMQDALKETKGELKETKDELKETKGELKETKDELKETKDELKEAKDELKETKDTLKKKDDVIIEQEGALKEKDDVIIEQEGALKEKDNALKKTNDRIKELENLVACLIEDRKS